jgi:hypothetical protein
MKNIYCTNATKTAVLIGAELTKKQLTHKKRLTKNKKDGIIIPNIRGSAIFASQN